MWFDCIIEMKIEPDYILKYELELTELSQYFSYELRPIGEITSVWRWEFG